VSVQSSIYIYIFWFFNLNNLALILSCKFSSMSLKKIDDPTISAMLMHEVLLHSQE
jgi:hypothetical protein